MRYPACEKLEIIQLVEHSHLPVRRTLVKLGIPGATFYRWYDLYRTGGPDALGDRSPRPDRVWNQIPDVVCQRIIRLALDAPALSPRELAVRFTDTESYFVSEASVYRLLKAHDLIASPAFIVMKAADEFKDKTTAPNQLLADRLHLSESHRLGLVLPVDRPRRLLALHHRLEAVPNHEGRGCHRHAGLGAEGLGARPGKGHPPAKASLRQRLQLHLERSSQVAQQPEHGACPRRALSSDDPRAISKPRSRPSSPATITCDITRASPT